MYRVLIVEDDPMVAMIHRQFLAQNPDFEVVGVCGDGAAALKFAETNDVDLVILDVHMPRVGGLELLHKLRARNCPIGVVMVTAANDVATLEEAFQLGVVDYIVKPFSYDRFTAALEKFAAQRRALRGSAFLSQEKIDLFIGGAHNKQSAQPVPKGIQEQTVSVLVEFIKNAEQEWQTGDEIAQHVGLSSVTVRRYMNYLVKINVVESQMDYETGGRPRLLYRVKKEPGVES